MLPFRTEKGGSIEGREGRPSSPPYGGRPLVIWWRCALRSAGWREPEQLGEAVLGSRQRPAGFRRLTDRTGSPCARAATLPFSTAAGAPALSSRHRRRRLDDAYIHARPGLHPVPSPDAHGFPRTASARDRAAPAEDGSAGSASRRAADPTAVGQRSSAPTPPWGAEPPCPGHSIYRTIVRRPRSTPPPSGEGRRPWLVSR